MNTVSASVIQKKRKKKRKKDTFWENLQGKDKKCKYSYEN